MALDYEQAMKEAAFAKLKANPELLLECAVIDNMGAFCFESENGAINSMGCLLLARIPALLWDPEATPLGASSDEEIREIIETAMKIYKIPDAEPGSKEIQ